MFRNMSPVVNVSCKYFTALLIDVENPWRKKCYTSNTQVIESVGFDARGCPYITSAAGRGEGFKPVSQKMTIAH